MLLGKPLEPEGGKATPWVCQLGQGAKPCFWRTCPLSTLTSASHCRNVGQCPTGCGRAEEWRWRLVWACCSLSNFQQPLLSSSIALVSVVFDRNSKIIDSDHFITLLFVLVEGLTSRASYSTVFCNVTAFIFVELLKVLLSVI